MKKGLAILLVIVLIVLVLGATVISRYNKIQKAKVGVTGAWGEVENVYQSRFDLIPNLVNTVKGAANFEQETLTAVTEARSRMGGQINLPESALTDPNAMAQFQSQQAGLSSALSRLMVVVEQYPDLKANQNFLQLQAQLEGIENRIRVARMRYNESVTGFNQMIVTFPNNLLASMFGVKSFEFFKADEAASTAPVVNFE
ncbi:MAG TPA: LemA family protein [Candidatus Cloacimonadota bacterium]|nr:LemA family protein [Candidatus Cloacimonadota bacterium]